MIKNSTEILEYLKNEDIKNRVKSAVLSGDLKNRPTIAEYAAHLLDKRYSSDESLMGAINFYLTPLKSVLDFTPFEKINKRRLQVHSILKNHLDTFQDKSYLDFGCGNGKITHGIVSTLKPRVAYGTDIIDTRDEGRVWNFQFSFIGSFTFECMDIVTASTVFHHIEDLYGSIRAVHRVMKTGGLLLVREFNALTDEDKIFNYIMDSLFYRGYLNCNVTPVTNNYYSKETWTSLFLNAKFELVDSCENIKEDGNPYNPFFLLLRKV